MRRFKKFFYFSSKGFSLVEVLLAVAIFALLSTTLIGVLIYSQKSAFILGERDQAMFLAEEGLEAVRSIRDENFINLINGVHGIAISGGKWIFSGNSDSIGVFTRSITISEIDIDTKLATAEIVWGGLQGGTNVVSLSTRLNDWKIYNPTEAEQLTVDLSNSQIKTGSTFYVTGLTMENTGIEDITVKSSEVFWSGVSGNVRLVEILMNGNIVWTGSDVSGSLQDISDFLLQLGGGAYSLEFGFDRAITGISMQVNLNMADNYTKQIAFNPGEPLDTIPPSNISNLSVSNPTTDSVRLLWTSPGDDGSAGTASLYDIRYSTSAITSINWDSAVQVSGEPIPLSSGSSESIIISGLLPFTQYYFAIKTSDESSNQSGLSNIAIGSTLAPAQANYLIVNTAGAVRSNANKDISGITLQNSGPMNITIATMTVSWSGILANRRLNSINIGGNTVWSGTAISGTNENITDILLNTVSPAISLNYLRFNNTITGIVLNINFNMSDGSVKTVNGIIPL